MSAGVGTHALQQQAHPMTHPSVLGLTWQSVFAQFLTLCSASTRGEARRIPAPSLNPFVQRGELRRCLRFPRSTHD
jgi:hypothetical protein